MVMFLFSYVVSSLLHADDSLILNRLDGVRLVV